jgi:ethanolamine utilization protein EutA
LSIKPLLSVGIDVGTTSMHLSINRLLLSNVSKIGEPERVVVSGYEKVYASPICVTPLTVEGVIDADAILSFIVQQYGRAGVKVDDIASGAVIVTGETAKIRNAEAVIKQVSSLSGQFVVASAGPDFESVLAGRGSGAAAYSKDTNKVICNVDIGGGTTNIAVFKGGVLKSTSAVGLGGRLVRLTEQLKVSKITRSARLCFEQLRIATESGVVLSRSDVCALADYAAARLVEAITVSEWTAPFLLTEPLSLEQSVDEYWFSGGIAQVMRDLSSVRSDTEYGDLGVFLARALHARLNAIGLCVIIPPDAIRATVIGASVHTLQISGSTVWVSENVLPLSGIPVIEPSTSCAGMSAAAEQSDRASRGGRSALPSSVCRPDSEDFISRVANCLKGQSLDWAETAVALSLPDIGRADYQTTKEWADLIVTALHRFRARPPYVVITPHDVAIALGQCLRVLIPDALLVCLDGVSVDGTGVVLDIGRPVAGAAVPVVVKSMVFPT